MSAQNSLASLALSSNPSASANSPTVQKTSDMKAAKKSAQDFESFFASQMLSEMFAGVKTDSMFGGGNGEDMFRSLLLDQYGKEIAKHGGLGIADSVMRTLTQHQEVAQ
jgi:Rod binding domain-containing protein